MHDSIEFLIFPPVNVQLTKIELVFQNIASENESAANKTTQASPTRDGDCLEFPEYVPRSSWCGSYSACHNPTYSPTYITCTHTIIHHGASPYSYTDGAAVVRSYWNYHVNSNGWEDIGYNYLFDKNGNVLCIIDLDTVMPSFVFSDYGDFLRTAANTGLEDDPNLDNIDFNMEIYEAFTNGYLESTKDFLLPVEKENLPYATLLFPYMQTVRFLADYINGDTYYKIRYPEHNLVRTKAQWRLFERAEAKLIP